MRIAIDARWIFSRISGIGAYTQELIRHLARIDRRNEYLLFFDNGDVRDRTVAAAGLGEAPNFQTRMLPWGVFSPRSQCFLPTELRKAGIDVFHSTNYMIPIFAFPRRHRNRATACVTTVHDVIPLIFPHHAPQSRKSRLFPLYRRLMTEIGVRSTCILTDSQASRRDIIRHLGIPEASAAKVRTVYCGVSERFRPADAPNRPLVSTSGEAGHTPVKKLLYVGRLDPYKNVDVLVRVLARLRATFPVPVTLTLAGAPDPRYPEARLLAADLGVREAVVWTGYLDDPALVALYQSADVLVHASRYEGFGLQVAEAMACGLPVVCSNRGSLPEVAGDAAILVDPDDEAGIEQSVREVLTRPSLAADMSRKGISRAAEFTWTRTARETLTVYEEVTAG